MADVSKLKIRNTIYDIKDTTARTALSNLGTASTKDYATVAIGGQGEDTGRLPTVAQVKAYVQPLVSGSMHFIGKTTQQAGETEEQAITRYLASISHTPVAGDVVIVGSKEFVYVSAGASPAWEQLGDEETLYATVAELKSAEGVGWTSETIKGNADGVTSLNGITTTHTNDINTLSGKITTIEGKPAYTIATTDINNWNSKQAAISDLDTIRTNAGLGATAVQPGELAAVAKSGEAKDLTTDSTHRLVTDTQINNWNSATVGYIRAVDTPFSVDSTNGKLSFASGYSALTTAQSNKLSGIADNATFVEATNGTGKISINGVEKTISLPNTVQDANYRHIDVTTTSVTMAASGSSPAVTMTKYSHPAGSGASKASKMYKFSTDSTSHISGVTEVTGADIAGKLSFITAYDGTNNKIATAADIAGGIKFKGSTTLQAGETVEQALARLVPNPANGDLAIVDTAEYIYNTNVSPAAWVMIGDENAWDTKGSAAAALVSAKSYADGKITALSGSATASSGYALSSVTETNGIISKATQIKIPTNNSELTNGAGYATTAEVTQAINTAIHGAIAASY